MELEDNLDILEHALINLINNDDDIRNESAGIIEEIEKTDNCFGLFFEILFNSGEPCAKNQASIQLHFMLNLRIKKIDEAIKDSIQKMIVEYLIKIPNNSQVILNKLSDSINLLILSNDNQTWTELDQFIEQFPNTLDFRIINILSDIICSLDYQLIETNLQIYLEIAAFAIISSDDLQINSAGISILSTLISVSESLDGLEEVFAKIDNLINEDLQQPNNLIIDQTYFWKSINKLINYEIFPPELITSILNFIMNPDILESLAILALDSIIPVFKDFSIDQIFSLIHQIIFFSEKYIENELQLPDDFMANIGVCFTYFPHSQIYEYLKSVIEELLPLNAPLAIDLYSPIIGYAPEQITKDIESLIEILEQGFSSEDPLIIEACSTVVQMMDGNLQLISKCFDSLFPVILPLILIPDPDIRKDIYDDLSTFFLMPDNKIDISVISELWQFKENIEQDDYSIYFNLFGNAIKCSEQLDDSQVNEILEFIQPALEDPSNPDFTSSALFIIGQLICNGEFAEIESVIPSTFEATKFCLTYENNEARFNALQYLDDLATSYGESVSEMLIEFWPIIDMILQDINTIERILQCALFVSINIAQLCEQQNIIERVLYVLEEEFLQKHYETYLKCSSKIIKLVDEQIYNSLFVKVIYICMQQIDIDDAKICFKALYKFLKYSTDNNRENVINSCYKIIKKFYKGSLPFLNDMSILDPEVDIDIDLVDNFSEFLSKFVSFPSQYVEPVCENVLKMADRDEDEYKNFVIQIFIDAIENETLPENVFTTLIDNLEPFLAIQDDGSQQNIVYLLIVILKQYPSFIESIEKLIPYISEWWTQSMTNTTRYASLISNMASLFLRLESLTSGMPQDIVEQSLDFYPPSDLSETQGMSECIISIFENRQIESKPISNDFRLKAALGIAKLLTESIKKLKKMNLQDDTREKLLELFKILCQDQEIAQFVVESLAKNEKRQSSIIEIIQS